MFIPIFISEEIVAQRLSSLYKVNDLITQDLNPAEVISNNERLIYYSFLKSYRCKLKNFYLIQVSQVLLS